MNVENIINNNKIFVTKINQLFHNKGIEFNNRLGIIIEYINFCLYNSKITNKLDINFEKEIISLINSISIDPNELYQILFMFYGNKKTKLNLDQYYTPFTIGSFMCNLMQENKKVIDPACGTGDLVKCYNGNISLWDISPEVLDVCKQNYLMNKRDFELKCLNSIEDYTRDNNTYDYCCLNPPFGSSTVISDKKILNKYILGENKKKEEIGIIFIERAINLVKENGIVFIILPNGYLGNSSKNIKRLIEYLLSFRIVAILELPNNTFSRSGTGVSTSLLILQKIKTNSNYNIFIKKINNIGYVLNKKNTPYKYKTVDGNYLIKNGQPVLDNNFVDCYDELSCFLKNEQVSNFKLREIIGIKYEMVNTKDLENNILDINRYLNNYKSIISNSKFKKLKTIKNYCKNESIENFVKENDKEYIYLDIKQITTPMYKKDKVMYGYDLPSRAKIKLNKYDIIVSKLKGKISFTIILDDAENIVCSNGFSLIRPKNYDNAIIIFSNLFTDSFKIQHNSLCTGSIMETLTDRDIKNIYITENIDSKKYKKILEALVILNSI